MVNLILWKFTWYMLYRWKDNLNINMLYIFTTIVDNFFCLIKFNRFCYISLSKFPKHILTCTRSIPNTLHAQAFFVYLYYSRPIRSYYIRLETLHTHTPVAYLQGGGSRFPPWHFFFFVKFFEFLNMKLILSIYSVF